MAAPHHVMCSMSKVISEKKTLDDERPPNGKPHVMDGCYGRIDMMQM